MAKLGKTNAGAVPDSAPSLKSRGLKNPMPAEHSLEEHSPDMTMGNDKPGKSGKAPESKKKAPGEMPS